MARLTVKVPSEVNSPVRVVLPHTSGASNPDEPALLSAEPTRAAMSGGIRLLLTVVACALATPAAAQAPAPTTAFDGKYIGVATLTTGVPECSAITSVHMTIAGGQVVIHVIRLQSSGRGTFRGSVNAAGEVSASRET
jgi:hypothetical protein